MKLILVLSLGPINYDEVYFYFTLRLMSDNRPLPDMREKGGRDQPLLSGGKPACRIRLITAITVGPVVSPGVLVARGHSVERQPRPVETIGSPVLVINRAVVAGLPAQSHRPASRARRAS